MHPHARQREMSTPDSQAASCLLGALSQVRVSSEPSFGSFSLADHLARRGNASPRGVHDRDGAEPCWSWTVNCG